MCGAPAKTEAGPEMALAGRIRQMKQGGLAITEREALGIQEDQGQKGDPKLSWEKPSRVVDDTRSHVGAMSVGLLWTLCDVE